MDDFENSYIKPDLLKSLESSSISLTAIKPLREIFKYAFIQNCNLDDASVTEEELQTLEELDQSELLDNIRNIISTLLTFKSNCKSASTGELATRCDLLEKLLQKQEAEVRNHIKIEHQLKLHIESIQQKVVDLEKNLVEAQNMIKEMEGKGLETMQTKLKKIEARFQAELSRVIKDYKDDAFAEAKNNEKVKKFQEMYEKKEKMYVKLLQDYNKIKAKLEETVQDYENLKSVNKPVKSRSISSGFNLRRSSFNDELNKVQHIGNVYPNEDVKYHEKETRNQKDSKIEESLSCFKSSPSPIDYKNIEPIPPPLELKQNSAGKIGKINQRRHIRSISDYARPVSAVKKQRIKNK